MSYIDSGRWKKTQSIQTFKFNVTFEKPPIVLVSPYWEGEHTEVGHAETIDTIEQNQCTLASGNAATTNYLVNWVAIGVQEKKG
jgi:hypothetical protein